MLGRFARRAALLALFAASFCILAGQPTDSAHAQACSTTIKDSRKGVVGCVQLHAGVVIAHTRYNGSGVFFADLQTQDPTAAKPLSQDPSAYKNSYQLFNSSGRVGGAAALMVPSDNTYYLVIDASGPYEFNFEQPTPETVSPVNQTSFTGKAQDVSPYFQLPAGPMSVTIQADSTALQFWLYGVDDLGGGPIPAATDANSSDGRLVSAGPEGPPISRTINVVIPTDGIYFFYAIAYGSAGSFSWTASVQ
ncbi:MAG TPA: hypothetical protein VK821_21600 [Dehalococcoidia bacterium]|nr:hypothetical protein [Dehalococcoidia bacterium]